jgi:hypothetical protein
VGSLRPRRPQVHDRAVLSQIANRANYQNVARLPNPIRDEAIVAEALRHAGFQTVTVSSDLGRETFVQTLRDFAPSGQTSLPREGGPPATTTQTTGEARRDPVVKKMNEDEKQKVDTKGK